MRGCLALVTLALAIVTGCSSGSHPKARAPLTEHERDSVLARSDLPGGAVVGRALDLSDESASRASQENAAVDSLFR